MSDATNTFYETAIANVVRRVKKRVTFAPAARASLATALTGTNNDLDISAVEYGSAGNDISIQYKDPGLPSQSISVEVDGTDIVVNLATGGGTNEVQTLTVLATGGSFVLSFKGTATGTLPYNVSDTDLQAALESVPTIGSGNVDVSASANIYTITFQGDLAATNVPLLVADGNRLTPIHPRIVTATTTPGDGTHNEVQTVSLQNAAVGTFTLTFDGQTTSALAYGASAATVQTALRALSSITGTNVNVTKSGDVYTLTFVGTLGDADQPQTTADASGLRPSATVVETTPGAAYAITSTATNIKTALAASDAADALVTAANHSANDGSGVVTAMPATNLAGGTDALGVVAATAVLSTNLTGTNNDLDFTAVPVGNAGNGITVTYVDPGGATASLSVTVDVQERAITVNLARAASAITTTAAQIITAIAGNTDAAALVVATNHAGNDGTGIVTAMSASALTGGASNVSLFSVVGNVLAAVVLLPQVTFTGASATLKVGTTEDDDVFIVSTVATNAAKGIIVDKTGVVAAGTAPVTAPYAPMVDGDVVNLKPGTANITGGQVDAYCYYIALDSDALVRAA